MGLPVLRLPHVAFDNVYQFLDVSDKIVFSQCSRRVQDLVSSQECLCKGRRISIDFYRGCATVQVARIDDFSICRLFTLGIFCFARNHKLTPEKTFFNLTVDGTTWDVKKCPPSVMGEWYCVSEEGIYERDVLIIVKMLRNLLNCSTALSKISLNFTNVNFQKLFVETDALHRADSISIDEQLFAPKDMDFMFDHFVANCLVFRGYCGPEYSYQKPWKFPIVELAHATWVNLENVFEMNKTSKHVRLYEAKLIGDKEINQFIKWWLTSDNNTLEFLMIARGQLLSLPQPPPGPDVVMNRSVILEGIESTPGKKKREDPMKLTSYIEWENGVDIVRKDGVQATIVLRQRESYDEFLFAVWHHPNPNVEEVTDN